MKNVKITFSMISRPSGGYKFQRHNAVIELPMRSRMSSKSGSGKAGTCRIRRTTIRHDTTSRNCSR